MVDFNEILKKSLLTVNEGYQRAYEDLSSVVAGVRESIKQNAGQEFTIELSQISAQLEGTSFQIYMDTDVNNSHAQIYRITDIEIPQTGYPIFLGAYNRVHQTFMRGEESFEDAEAISTYFAEQLSNPESRLIQLIGFALRRRQES